MNAWFHRFAHLCTQALGSVQSFMGFLGSVLIWLALGWFLRWSDTWQISYMNALTILTMLVVVLQLYMSRITESKLDELLKGTPGASNRAILLEQGTAIEARQLQEEHQREREECDDTPHERST